MKARAVASGAEGMCGASAGPSVIVLLAASLPVAAVAGQPAVPTDDAETAMYGAFTNGEDITRPRNLFQVRQRYSRLPDTEGREPEKWTTTLRADLWTGLGGGWKLYGRLDEPLVYSDDVTSSFNPNGHSRFGQGDLLTEVAIIAPPPTARIGYGLGVRVVWRRRPTVYAVEASGMPRMPQARPAGRDRRRTAAGRHRMRPGARSGRAGDGAGRGP